MFISSTAKGIFFGIVRHFATFVGGWLVARGILQDGQLTGWLGSVIFLGSVVWSASDKAGRTGEA
jgi:hypothetical protein